MISVLNRDHFEQVLPAESKPSEEIFQQGRNLDHSKLDSHPHPQDFDIKLMQVMKFLFDLLT
jgi:hypothetical protein